MKMDDSENGGFGCARSVVLIDFGRSIDLQSGHSDCNTPLDSAAYLQHSRNGDAAAVTAAFNSNCCINKVRSRFSDLLLIPKDELNPHK